jgi:hypothetical protein
MYEVSAIYLRLSFGEVCSRFTGLGNRIRTGNVQRISENDRASEKGSTPRAKDRFSLCPSPPSPQIMSSRGVGEASSLLCFRPFLLPSTKLNMESQHF